jgi:hypothetical protein
MASAVQAVFARATHSVDIKRDPVTGVITREQWWKDGKLDRINGPAFIVRNAATGAVTDNQWWRDGERITPPVPTSQIADVPSPQRAP